MGFDQLFAAFTDIATATGAILEFEDFAGSVEVIRSGNALGILPGLAKRLGR